MELALHVACPALSQYSVIESTPETKQSSRLAESSVPTPSIIWETAKDGQFLRDSPNRYRPWHHRGTIHVAMSKTVPQNNRISWTISRPNIGDMAPICWYIWGVDGVISNGCFVMCNLTTRPYEHHCRQDGFLRTMGGSSISGREKRPLTMRAPLYL